MDRARSLETRLNNIRSNLPVLSLKTYFMFLFFVFFLTGFGMLLVCLLEGVHPLLVDAMSSPFLYFGLGFICFFCFIYCKVTNFTS